MNRILKKVKNKRCKVCGSEFPPFKTTDRYCSGKCARIDQKPIKNKSERRIKEDREYSILRKEFLSLPENKFCFVDGCNRLANTIEHKKGRIGSNYLDTSTWEPCCFQHNGEFENNTELSMKYQESKFHEGKKIDKRV